MIEVNIKKKLNDEKFVKLINFLYSLSSEIGFTSFHNYHIDENVCVDVLNEYKQRCKDKHRELQEIYDRKEPFLMKVLKKIGVKTQDGEVVITELQFEGRKKMSAKDYLLGDQ